MGHDLKLRAAAAPGDTATEARVGHSDIPPLRSVPQPRVHSRHAEKVETIQCPAIKLVLLQPSFSRVQGCLVWTVMLAALTLLTTNPPSYAEDNHVIRQS